ncbi:MAG: class I SAM-dependent methyltransferase [Candidatus Doudnabacteria bacterium]
MKDNWHDPGFASDWDKDTERGNPARLIHLELIKRIVIDNYRPENTILDIGAGSGQVEALIMEVLPQANIVAVDSSEVMSVLAKRRLENYLETVKFIKHDLNQINKLVLPKHDYKIAIACQVLHEVPDKKKIIEYIFKKLSHGGIFLLADRLKVDLDKLEPIYKTVFDWNEHKAKLKWEKSFEFYQEKIATKDDFAVTLDENLGILSAAGFEAACIHLQLDRVLIGGVKK